MFRHGILILLGGLFGCHPELEAEFMREICIVPDSALLLVEADTEDTVDWDYLLANRYEMDRKGRQLEALQMEQKLVEASPVEVYFPPIGPEFKQALRRNIRLLDAIDHPQKEALKEASYRLLHFEGDPQELQSQFKLKQSWGTDKRGNAKFTGYYSPFLNVKAHPDERYLHPIYRKPPNWEGPLPDRRAIQEGILEDKDLTIAWTNDPIGLYYMQIQGSGFIKYKDEDRLELLKFSGGNGHPYRSIETYLAEQDRYPISSISINGIRTFFKKHPELLDSILALNPSYTFFARGPSQVIGAGGVPLTAN
ncbi:MAG: MltA domain-containing protein, partial [Phaeodactylibacter sp.]|nr:MltA domain-containing protein [Phaeodactylibacter sp.]